LAANNVKTDPTNSRHNKKSQGGEGELGMVASLKRRKGGMGCPNRVRTGEEEAKRDRKEKNQRDIL